MVDDTDWGIDEPHATRDDSISARIGNVPDGQALNQGGRFDQKAVVWRRTTRAEVPANGPRCGAERTHRRLDLQLSQSAILRVACSGWLFSIRAAAGPTRSERP
jgi:hypothetical protein